MSSAPTSEQEKQEPWQPLTIPVAVAMPHGSAPATPTAISSSVTSTPSRTERSSPLTLSSNQAQGALTAWLAAAGSQRRPHLTRELVAIRHALAGEHPTPIELLLIDRICIAWLATEICETAYASLQASDHSRAAGDYARRRAEFTDRRLLRAIRALATIRRMDVSLLYARIERSQ